MYADHFKLKQRPFAHHPGENFVAPNDDVATAISRLEHVLVARDAVAVVSGGPGVGKSAVIEKALQAVADQAVVAHVDLRQTDPELIFESLLLSLGGDPQDGREAYCLHQLTEVIGKLNEDGRRVTAAIDVTGLTAERAKRILRLINLSSQPGGQLNIILQGPHTLHRLLDVPGLIHLRQRVCFRHRVRPLNVEETTEYLKQQLEAAGGDSASILADGVAESIHRYVAGVPRLINTLMDATLSEAAVQSVDELTAEHVGDVAQRLGWKPLGQPAAAQKRKTVQPAPPASQPSPPETASKPADTAEPVKQFEVDEKLFSKATAKEDNRSTPTWLKPNPDQQAPAPPADAAPASDATAALMLSTLKLDEIPKPEPAEETESAPNTPEAAEPASAMPEMNPDDTSATGMLRLEDLDDKFAETVFGQDSGVFAALLDPDKKKANEQ